MLRMIGHCEQLKINSTLTQSYHLVGVEMRKALERGKCINQVHKSGGCERLATSLPDYYVCQYTIDKRRHYLFMSGRGDLRDRARLMDCVTNLIYAQFISSTAVRVNDEQSVSTRCHLLRALKRRMEMNFKPMSSLGQTNLKKVLINE